MWCVTSLSFFVSGGKFWCIMAFEKFVRWHFVVINTSSAAGQLHNVAASQSRLAVTLAWDSPHTIYCVMCIMAAGSLYSGKFISTYLTLFWNVLLASLQQVIVTTMRGFCKEAWSVYLRKGCYKLQLSTLRYYYNARPSYIMPVAAHQISAQWQRQRDSSPSPRHTLLQAGKVREIYLLYWPISLYNDYNYVYCNYNIANQLYFTLHPTPS